ncbi:MAG TPA: hypothetical protein VKA87_04595 [Nitrososphaeraceae archaeon]|nr:hypothetical protein [Nitrososphaeraceae archaeon]
MIQCKSKTVVMMASLTWQTHYLFELRACCDIGIFFNQANSLLMIIAPVMVFLPMKCRGFSATGRKSSSRQLPLRLDSVKVHTYATPIPAIMAAATANTPSPSPPFHLLTMILFAIATPKIILTMP